MSESNFYQKKKKVQNKLEKPWKRMHSIIHTFKNIHNYYGAR